MGVTFRETGERNKDSLEATMGRSFAFGWKCRCGADKLSIYRPNLNYAQIPSNTVNLGN